MNVAGFPFWFELAVVWGLTAFGGIFFGHFEERTPKGRRVLKLVLLSAGAVALSAGAGRGAFFVALGLLLVAVVVVHAWWLPRQGINGWTGEPRARYYALRGWDVDERKS